MLTRRLGGLPDDDRARRCGSPACSAASSTYRLSRAPLGADEDDVLDDLDPALAAGLVREYGVDRFRFAHALVRDTAYAGLSRSRRARGCTPASPRCSPDQPGRESEVARHWLAAGPQHAAQAWRAAVDAAEAARRVYAYDEAVDLLPSARGRHRRATRRPPPRTCTRCSSTWRAPLLTDNLVDLRTVVQRALSVPNGSTTRPDARGGQRC